ncbi:hypothetical protein DYB32_010909, partial [Aphanomyces invadans]
RDLNYRIQHHANSPEQREQEKRCRPGEESDEAMDSSNLMDELVYSDSSTGYGQHGLIDDSDESFEPRSPSDDVMHSESDDVVSSPATSAPSEDLFVAPDNFDLSSSAGLADVGAGESELAPDSNVPMSAESEPVRLQSVPPLHEIVHYVPHGNFAHSIPSAVVATTRIVSQTTTFVSGPRAIEARHLAMLEPPREVQERSLAIPAHPTDGFHHYPLLEGSDSPSGRPSDSSSLRLENVHASRALPASPVPATATTLAPTIGTDADARPDLVCHASPFGLEPPPTQPMIAWDDVNPDHELVVHTHPTDLDAIVAGDVDMDQNDGWPRRALLENDEMETEEALQHAVLTTNIHEISDRIQALQNWTMTHENEIAGLARETGSQLSDLRDSALGQGHRLDELARRLHASEELLSAGISDSVSLVTERTSLLNCDLHSTRLDLSAQISDLQQEIRLLRDGETHRDLLETTVRSQQSAITKLENSLRRQDASKELLERGLQANEAHLTTTLSSVRVQVEELSRGLKESALGNQQLLGESRRHIAALQESNARLHQLVSTLSADKAHLLDRIQLLETRIDQQQAEFATRLDGLARESRVPRSDSPTPSPSPSAHQLGDLPNLVSELKAAMSKMTTEFEEVKESIQATEHSKLFGLAVKYTSVPTSDEQAQCEFFIKQLLDQADRCRLDDDE